MPYYLVAGCDELLDALEKGRVWREARYTYPLFISGPGAVQR